MPAVIHAYLGAASLQREASAEAECGWWRQVSSHTCCTPSELSFAASNVICPQDSGRHGVREAGAVTPLVQLLDSPQSKVQARAVGALHNLSSDSNSIRLIRRGGGIPKLVHLLRWAPRLGLVVSARSNMQMHSPFCWDGHWTNRRRQPPSKLCAGF